MNLGWDDLEAEAKSRSGHMGSRCGVDIMLEGLSEAGKAAVNKALANTRITASGLHKALTGKISEEDLVSTYTLRRHRKGECACERNGS